MAVRWDKGELSEEKGIERLISLLGAFHRKINNVRSKEKNDV